MQTRQFHLGDVLSITTGRLVSPRQIDGVYDILNFMTGDNLFTHQIPRAIDECKLYLLSQFPQLDNPEMDSALVELIEALKAKGRTAEKVLENWLTKQVAKHGEMFAVKPIPAIEHERKNPIVEAAEIMGGPEKIIVINI